MFTSNQHHPQSEKTTTANSLVKLVVFEVGKLTLALPIKQVQKVVKYAPIHGSGLSHINITHLEDREVAVIDLHQKLFKYSPIERANFDGYFIITKDTIGESLGILVAKMPTLMDLPLSQIRLLPNSYRYSDTLEIASHVTVISHKNTSSVTIFILDLERLI